MNKKVDILQAITERSMFYKDNFVRLIKVLTISVAMNCLLVVALLYLALKTEQPSFISVDATGKLVQLKYNNQAPISDQMILSWVNAHVSGLYALDFLNYRMQMQENKRFFTEDGWQSFTKAFTPVINEIKAKKLIASASIISVPIMTEKGHINAIRSWKIQVPMLIEYAHNNKVEQLKVLLLLTIQQVKDSDESLGIAQIVQSAL